MTRIRRLLIANRGEIVRRIRVSAVKLGIETVSVYAGDDALLPHAFTGDFQCALEGETLAETYLNIDQLVRLAKASGADAVHPGYGFLSENAAFARAVTEAGLIFVGPPGEVIARMGDKAASRRLCEEIGVPVIPGYDGEGADFAVLKKEATRIGYPVLAKAAAGGGGKGMRVVEREKELQAALESASAEALSAFGDGRLLLERYLQQPRHIEVQIFSDSHGNHVHLFERECSIQRRHQKIVEESPAPNLPDATRQKMFAAAITIARHIGYVGAGTVEFILDRSGEFYFLEMNTRLQVEHPVTEAVTGLDLVRLQLEVAQGAKLPFTQQDIVQVGHAVEVRLYAEEPERGFLPSSGELAEFSLPHLRDLRCENGYASGCRVSARYDPMLAKLCGWGITRAEAIALLCEGLSETRVTGVATNRAFLLRILNSVPFREGRTATDFISRHAELLEPALSDEELARMAAAALTAGAPLAPAPGGEERSAWTATHLAGFR